MNNLKTNYVSELEDLEEDESYNVVFDERFDSNLSEIPLNIFEYSNCKYVLNQGFEKDTSTHKKKKKKLICPFV